MFPDGAKATTSFLKACARDGLGHADKEGHVQTLRQLGQGRLGGGPGERPVERDDIFGPDDELFRRGRAELGRRVNLRLVDDGRVDLRLAESPCATTLHGCDTHGPDAAASVGSDST